MLCCVLFGGYAIMELHTWSPQRWKSIFKDSQPVLDRKETSHRLEAVRSLAPEQRSFCRRCGRLLLEQEPESHRDEGHSVQEGLSITELAEPSKLLSPVDDRKAQAVGRTWTFYTNVFQSPSPCLPPLSSVFPPCSSFISPVQWCSCSAPNCRG